MIKVEITDTFAGEANYSWVNRWQFDNSENLTNRQILKKIRKHFGITCKLRREYETHDLIKYRFDKQCVCMFITFGE